MKVMGTPSDSDLDVGEPVEREGHETLLPSVTRSVLSGKSFVGDLDGEARDSFAAGEMEPPARPSASGSVAPSIEQAIVAEAEKPRGARSGDLIGGRYVVE